MEIIDVILNPNDKTSGITLSNNNLTTSQATSTVQGVRATHGKSSGKWYWEVKLNSGETSVSIGVSNKNFNISNQYIVGTDANLINYKGISSYDISLTVGTIIGVALDLDNGTLEFYKNGVNTGFSHTKIKELGEVYPTFRDFHTKTKTVTFNFGTSPFIYNVPSGFYPYNIEFEHKILLSSNSKTYSVGQPTYSENIIPVMTSNIGLNGNAFSSNNSSGNGLNAYEVFDGKTGTGWGRNLVGNVPIWIGFQFNSPKRITKYSVTAPNTSYYPTEFLFQGSNDAVTYVTLSSIANNTVGLKEFEINNSNFYSYYRIYITKLSSGTSLPAIEALKMYETLSKKLNKFSSYKEEFFIKHGMESPVQINQFNGLKSIESNSTAHESGKKFIHATDLSKRRVNKIILS
jgi:hypothetical protein